MNQSLQERCLRVLTECLASGYQLNIESLPRSVMDKFYVTLRYSRLINDSNIHLVLHPGSTEANLASSDVGKGGIVHLQRCKALRRLNLSANLRDRNVSEQCLVDLMSHLRSLEEVRLQGLAEVTSAVVHRLIQNNPHLTILDFRGCSAVDDATLVMLGSCCKHIKALNMSYTNITDAGILALVSGGCGPVLEELLINGCRSLTNYAIEKVVDYCPNLRILSFHKCPLITDISIGRMEQPKQISWSIF
ncbi:protein AMN1 homolog [Ornithodoros turicata]|uniref:protein AMN1 homolog n=1 Tax=Ornithodoros turicata TaxID=34597 RepID=UPI00313A015D